MGSNTEDRIENNLKEFLNCRGFWLIMLISNVSKNDIRCLDESQNTF